MGISLWTLNIHRPDIQSTIGHQKNISGDSDQQVTLGVEILLHTDFGRRWILLRHDLHPISHIY
jgi:hypothetical protein